MEGLYPERTNALPGKGVCVCVFWGGGGGGGGVTWLIFAGYVLLASQNSYPIIGYAVVTL